MAGETIVHTTTGSLFSAEQTGELFNRVAGHSALAKLSAQKPIPFARTDVFVFSMDGEASIVAEGANKPAGNAAFDKVTIKPLKLVYQHRITDEFVNMAEEKQLPYVNAFLDGFAKKMARALDICGMHGKNPADKTASTAIGSDRKTRLTAAGYDYATIQALVNAKLIKPAKKTNSEIAKEVIAGKWGNGGDRITKLKAAGYDPNAIQAEVNKQMGIGKKTVNQIAREVIQGKWGNGQDRINRLKKAGYDPAAVQAEVNRRYS